MPEPRLVIGVDETNAFIAVLAVLVPDFDGRFFEIEKLSCVATVIFGRGAKLGEALNADGKPLEPGLDVLVVGPEQTSVD